jgi:hypothetical protein
MAYARHLGLLLLLLAVIGLGYAGFRYFSAEVMPRSNAYNLLTLAVIAGVASFFSPCAFPLLPSYLFSVESNWMKFLHPTTTMAAGQSGLFQATPGLTIERK